MGCRYEPDLAVGLFLFAVDARAPLSESAASQNKTVVQFYSTFILLPVRFSQASSSARAWLTQLPAPPGRSSPNEHASP